MRTSFSLRILKMFIFFYNNHILTRPKTLDEKI